LGASFHDWHGERPILVADEEVGAIPVLRLHRDGLLLAGFSGEISGTLFVFRTLAGKNNALAAGTKDGDKLVYVEFLRCRDQRCRSLLGSAEALGAGRRAGRSRRSFFFRGLLLGERD